MKIFNPIIFLMNRLKYVGKFSIIGGLLAVPIIVMLFIIISNINDNLSIIEKRQSGAIYNQLLKELLQDVQQHRALAIGFLGGNHTIKDKMEEKQQEIIDDIQKIDDFNNQVIHDSHNWSQLKNDWNELVSNVNYYSTSEATDKYNSYIQKLLDYMRQVGDHSDILVGKSIQGVYLSKSTVQTLPNFIERLGQIQAYGLEAITAENNSEKLKNEIISLNSLIQESTATLRYEMEIMSDDQVLQESLSNLYNEVKNDTANFMDILQREIIQPSNITISSKEFYDLATYTIDKNFNLYDESVNLLVNRMNEQSDELNANRTLMITIILIVFLLVLYGFIGFYFSIQNNIVNLKNTAISIAAGDLTKEVSLNTKDEMNEIEIAFNEMIGDLRHLVSQINNNAQLVAASAEELNASSEQTTKATEHVASSIQQVSSGADTQMIGINESSKALEEISIGVQRIAENSSSVAYLSSKTEQQAEDGAKAIELNVSQMNNIHSSVSESNEIIKTLYNSSQEIGSILEVIKGIADQTNLLSLNASIEAARAGEHGKGFAVVAEEVRKLAEQSQQSSLQIAELIESIQNDTVKSVEVMTSVTENVESGLAISKQTAEKFAQILQGMNDIALQIQEVSATSEQMSASTQQVVAGVAEISIIAKENSTTSDEVVASAQEQLASMEEITSSANALTQMAEELQELVKTFKM